MPRKQNKFKQKEKRAPLSLKLPGIANPIDVHVGSRVRLRRTLLGMSQEVLGESVGLTFQQIQKYERGANRIGASRLYDISQVLDVPLSFFFDDMDENLKSGGATAKQGLADNVSAYESDPLARRETLELVRAYYRVADPAVRRKMFELIKSLANASETEHS